MEDTKKTPAELVADLMLDPGFVLVPQDRYEELIRAETERDVAGSDHQGREQLQCRQSSRRHSEGKKSGMAESVGGCPQCRGSTGGGKRC